MAAPYGGDPYYRQDLAHIHDIGFGFHADRVAVGILRLLEPVRAAGGLVLELGCGSGALTRHLLAAGHRVIATDASPAMLELARVNAPQARIARLTLPDDPLPRADAVVAVGHPLNYLPDEAAVRRTLRAAVAALNPGGVLALDIAELAYAANAAVGQRAMVHDDWAVVIRVSTPQPDRYVREITTFVRLADSSWRRDDERHDNVLVDAAAIPGWLAETGVTVRIGRSFGAEELPPGLLAIVGSAANSAGTTGEGPCC